MKRILIVMVIVCCLSNLSAQLKYPETPKIAVQDTLHGVVITDNYRWLEDSDDPDVLAWDDQQVALTMSITLKGNIGGSSFQKKRINSTI